EKLRWSLDVLRRTLQQRRELARRLQNAQESERQRIAADIHDDPIQVMSAIDMRLQTLAEFPASATPDAIAGIEAEVHSAIEHAPLDALRAPSRRPGPRGPRSRAPRVPRAEGESQRLGRRGRRRDDEGTRSGHAGPLVPDRA